MTVQIEEKSLELALVKAAGQLGLTQDELEYKIISESQGFLGIFGKKVSIEAWKRGQGGGRERRRASASENSTFVPLDEKKLKELKTELTTHFQEICQMMVGEKVEVEIEVKGDRLCLNAKNEFLRTQISKNARIAESLEHILRKMPRSLRGDWPYRIFVDADNIRLGREKELAGMAKDLSEKVVATKRPIVLNYRNSYDRKVIHMALDRDDRVYTKSIGSGPNRKLMILPSKGDEMDARD